MSTSDLIDGVVESQKEFVGQRAAMAPARKAPLEIGSDSEIKDFYGEEEVVLEILLEQYYSQTGEAGIKYTKSYLSREGMEIPEEVEMPESESLTELIIEKVKGIIPI